MDKPNASDYPICAMISGILLLLSAILFFSVIPMVFETTMDMFAIAVAIASVLIYKGVVIVIDNIDQAITNFKKIKHGVNHTIISFLICFSIATMFVIAIQAIASNIVASAITMYDIMFAGTAILILHTLLMYILPKHVRKAIKNEQ